MIGQEKISSLIIEKAQNLILSLAPKLTQLASELGIQNFGTPNMKLPDSCPPKEKLNKVISIRNNLYDKLNSTSRTIQNLSRPVGFLNRVVTTTNATLLTLKAARTTSNAVIAAIPPPTPIPGSVVASINTLKDLEEFLLPKTIKAQGIITSISLALDIANKILVKILNYLKIIDEVIKKCDSQSQSSPPPINEYLVQVEKQAAEVEAASQQVGSSQVYQGFVLEIETEQFSPTVKRIRAIAKNSSGITLLRTPYSFTTDAKSLIEQLKIIIDSSDLKAY